MKRFAVGIDLGTTNCALAFVDLAKAKKLGKASIETFSIPQLMDSQELGDSTLFPSFTYIVGEHESAAISPLPWQEDRKFVVGEAARKMGTRVPDRLVSSAKSWLCHAGVDRKADILPWSSEPDVVRISPVRASTLYLTHLRNAWNHVFAANDPEAKLENQLVVMTVPASFDEVARELTMEAARLAGLLHVTLLEEPQAAFYHWIDLAAGKYDAFLSAGSTIVVIDCGGGTTDFSLIAAVERKGTLEFERIAVGDHLLLGGDNMDIALARFVESKISPNRRLDSTQWGGLVLACRRVKEQMLGENPPDKANIVVASRGKSLIGGSLQYEISRETVLELSVTGFFPSVNFEEEVRRTAAPGLMEFGLPFVADPAITRHLSAFLREHASNIASLDDENQGRPAAVLFNGGVFNAETCRAQILQVLKSWYGESWDPKVLESSSLDLAVAQGAAYFGWAKETGARRIKSSAARSYYLGVDSGQSENAKRLSVLCVVPHRMKEEETLILDELPLELQIGEPVSFPLYTSTVRTRDKGGQVLLLTPEKLLELPGLATVLKGGKRNVKKSIPVQLESKLTEIGTLEIHCAAKDGQGRWRLQFQTRALKPSEATAPPEEKVAAKDEVIEKPPEGEAAQAIVDTWSEEQLAGAFESIRKVFDPKLGSRDPQIAVGLTKRLESNLEMGRDKWPSAVLRALWEKLLELSAGRKFSLEHEARWYNLAGFALRPGFGDPLDPFRVEQLWKIIHHGVFAGKIEKVWSEFWIMCRRAAGGLDANRQAELARRITSYLSVGPSAGKKSPHRVGPNELVEIWRAVASLERLDQSLKIELGDSLLKQMKKPPVGRFVYWSLTRLGSRSLMYGPANTVIPKANAERWIEAMLEIEIGDVHLLMERDFALAQLARRTGDRARDVDDALRLKVLKHLQNRNASKHWIRAVEEIAALEESEETRLFGDALPPGLKLIKPD